MARTLAEVDADLATLEAQVVLAKDRVVTLETRQSKIIKWLKAVIKRIKPNAVSLRPFEPWEAERKMEHIKQIWIDLGDNETDEIDDA